MLILTRRRSETIQIGDDICITVMRTARNSVKLGVSAPSTVRVLRGELSPDVRRVRQGDIIELDQQRITPAREPVSDQFPHPHIA